MSEIRLLRPDEIDVRISRIIDTGKSRGAALLLYKDARCDMNILDETFGSMNWQRHHSRDNANCIVSIWDESKSQWVEKEDTGTESNTEAAKGLASDSFKRACFNLGIGRELYSAPDILFWDGECEINDKGKCFDKFIVTEIKYEGRSISSVTVEDTSTGKSKEFTHKSVKKSKTTKVTEEVPSEEKADAQKTMEIGKLTIAPIKAQALISKCENEGVSVSKLCSLYKVKGATELTEKQYRNINDNWTKVVEQCGN